MIMYYVQIRITDYCVYGIFIQAAQDRIICSRYCRMANERMTLQSKIRVTFHLHRQHCYIQGVPFVLSNEVEYLNIPSSRNFPAIPCYVFLQIP